MVAVLPCAVNKYLEMSDVNRKGVSNWRFWIDYIENGQ